MITSMRWNDMNSEMQYNVCVNNETWLTSVNFLEHCKKQKETITNQIMANNQTPQNVTDFRAIAEELSNLYAKKNAAYGNSFGETFGKLGIISAITRISDKYNRLVNLTTHPDIDNLGESIDDTLMDTAAYCIMTLVELRKHKQNEIKSL